MLDAEKLKKLQDRQEQLAEVFIDETDPTKWPDDKTRDNRGDRYWHKRNAGATATLIVKIQAILDAALKRAPIADPDAPVPGGDEHEEDDVVTMAAAAMDEASRIIGKAKGSRFNRDGKKK